MAVAKTTTNRQIDTTTCKQTVKARHKTARNQANAQSTTESEKYTHLCKQKYQTRPFNTPTTRFQWTYDRKTT